MKKDKPNYLENLPYFAGLKFQTLIFGLQTLINELVTEGPAESVEVPAEVVANA